MTGKKGSVFDVFNPDEANDELNPTYYDSNDAIINIGDPLNPAIYPGNGGVTSPYNKLVIRIEYVGTDSYEVKTIQVNNPEKCNLKSFQAKSFDVEGNELNSNYFGSIQLNNDETLIDVSYLKEFSSFKENLEKFYILYIMFESTRDGSNPGSCELNCFVKVK